MGMLTACACCHLGRRFISGDFQNLVVKQQRAYAAPTQLRLILWLTRGCCMRASLWIVFQKLADIEMVSAQGAPDRQISYEVWRASGVPCCSEV
jgi:hypothetical protein